MEYNGMKPTFQLTFANGRTAAGAYIAEPADVEAILQTLGFKTACPSLVVVGGASGLAADDLEQLRSLFKDVLCPLAETFDFAVIDGGTDAGVMQLMGQARTDTGSSFPLIGVVVQTKAILPNASSESEDAAALEPHHTHFLLVPGDHWGEESTWIAQVATALVDRCPSITVLINGGAIALHQDVPNSLAHQRPVLVINGSGRAADRVAAAVMGKTPDPELQSLIDSGLIYVADLAAGPEALRSKLFQILAATNPS